MLKVKKICKECGKEFYVSPSRKDTAKFCSHKCLSNSKKQINVKYCKYCGKKFVVTNGLIKNKRGKYCCREHYYASQQLNNKYKIKNNYIEIYVNSKKNGSHTILIDKEDFEKIKNKTIGVYEHHSGSYYARVYIRELKKSIALHRIIMNAPKNMVVDHINHCTLDNRKNNLRLCTIGENNANRIDANCLNIIKNNYKNNYYKNWENVA